MERPIPGCPTRGSRDSQPFRSKQVIIQNSNNNLKCRYCKSIFSTIPNKRRHELHRCKLKQKNNIEQYIDTNEQESNTIEQNNNTIERNKKPIIKKTNGNSTNITNSNNNSNNNTNNIQNNNIQQNITINNFGNETTEHISLEFLDSLVCAPFSSIPKLTHFIHFDPNHPENDNIRITNKKDNFVDVRKDDIWLIEDRKKAIYQMMDNSYYLLDEHRNKYIEKFNRFKRNNWTRFADKYEEGDLALKRRFKNKIEIDIINNSRIKKYYDRLRRNKTKQK